MNRLIAGRNRFRRHALFMVALALVASACTSGAGDSTTTSTVGGSDTTAPSGSDGATTTKPSSSDTFRMAYPTIISTLDPAVYEGRPSTDVEIAWAAPLYEYTDPAGIAMDQRGLTGIENVEPYLAASDEEEENGSLVIKLHEAQSPYGNSLTAEDVKWTFERAVELDFVARFVMSVGRIDPENPIEVIDDLTFRVNVTQPNPYVRAVLTLWNLSPLDSVEALSHATADDPWASEWLAANTATFGPYFVTSFTPSEQIVLDTNPNFFGEAPGFASVVMQQVPDAGTRLQLLLTGDIDYAFALLPDQFQTVSETDGVEAVSRLSNEFDMVEMNFAFEPFQDQRVRQAIAMAIDRDAIVNGVMRGFADVAANQVPPALPQPPPPAPYTYDPDGARQLLEEAGYADSLSFPLAINLSRPGPYAEQIAVLIQSQLADVGIDAQINVVASSSEFEEAKTNGELTAWIGANTPMVPDVWYFWQLEHHSTDAFQNWKGYESEEFDAMLAELRDMPIGTERDAQISSMHEFLMNDVPYAPIQASRVLHGVGGNVDPDSVRAYTPYGPIVYEIQPAG